MAAARVGAAADLATKKSPRAAPPRGAILNYGPSRIAMTEYSLPDSKAG
jgi:hypothetical protein